MIEAVNTQFLDMFVLMFLCLSQEGRNGKSHRTRNVSSRKKMRWCELLVVS
jgi:hypothetical protein